MASRKSLQLVVFTDLDGTLLDHFTYSFEAALPGIQALKDAGVPWILTSSKTFAELRLLKHELANTWPCIFENGGGIAFDADDQALEATTDQLHPAHVEALGPGRDVALEVIATQRSDYQFTGFAEMNADQVATVTGLPPQRAALALQRRFTEPLLWRDTEQNLKRFTAAIESAGLRCVAGGRFVHVMGHFDKATAMRRLLALLPGVDATTNTVALGDSGNDIEMLRAADIPVVIKSPVHDMPEFHSDRNVMVSDRPGPAGWNEAILHIINECKL